jgi:hypothetical protein
MANYQDLVAQVLRESSEPLALDEILRRVHERQPITSAQPKRTIRNALLNSHLVESLGDGRHVYLAYAVNGSSFRIPLENLSPDGSRLVAGAEVGACLRATQPTQHSWQGKFDLTLADETTVQVPYQVASFALAASIFIDLPIALASWIEHQRQSGADTLVLRCQNAEAGAFTIESIRLADLDRVALEARNEQVLAIARDIVRRNPVRVPDFALRLVARGAYHGDPQPDSLPDLLFEVDGRFILDGLDVAFRSELTPALRKLFAERLQFQNEENRFPLGLWLLPEHEEGFSLEDGPDVELATIEEPPWPRRPAQHIYRLRVRLQWRPSVWRVIEFLDNQTLEDLHDAIQDAFGWDRDHLYAFFLSGKAWDSFTRVSFPPQMYGDSEPPYTDQIELADIELRPGMKFLYIFDFGDDMRHDVEVLEILPAPVPAPTPTPLFDALLPDAERLEAPPSPAPSPDDFPRVVETHGDPPPQYPNLEEWDLEKWND